MRVHDNFLLLTVVLLKGFEKSQFINIHGRHASFLKIEIKERKKKYLKKRKKIRCER